jgi:hypothetical protein
MKLNAMGVNLVGAVRQGGLAGLLIAAVVQQVVGTAADVAFDYSGIATDRALGAPRYNGILPGPRSPKAWQVQP